MPGPRSLAWDESAREASAGWGPGLSYGNTLFFLTLKPQVVPTGSVPPAVTSRLTRLLLSAALLRTEASGWNAAVPRVVAWLGPLGMKHR